MPSEKKIRERIIDELGKQGWIYWWPPKIRFRKQQDIFGIWDILFIKKDKIKFIQFTTKGNMKAREKKIRNWMKLYEVNVPSEVWGWNGRKRDFSVIYLS